MKSKERLWALTKKGPWRPKIPKRRKKKEIKIIKKEEKDLDLVRPEDMQQDEHQGPMTLMSPFETLRRGPWLTYGKTKVYVYIFSPQKKKKTIKNPTETGIIFVTHGPSPWDPEWIVREKWFS